MACWFNKKPGGFQNAQDNLQVSTKKRKDLGFKDKPLKRGGIETIGGDQTNCATLPL